jgi:cytochrome c peroxidase
MRWAWVLVLMGCAERPYEWRLPEGFPTPSLPEGARMSDELVELGRHLFFDERLSLNETQSCGSCHLQELAFTDGEAHAVGSTGDVHRRSSMGLSNIAYASALTWASDAVRTLEDQALLPIFSEVPIELGMAGEEELLISRFTDDAVALERFELAFRGEKEPVTLGNLVAAIAAYERTLISGNAPYDRYVAGDSDAISEEAKRGLSLFLDETHECFHCHGGFAFTDAVRSESTVFAELLFHNTGLYNVDGQGGYPALDRGLIELTGVPSDMGRFRAPTLRNIAVTAPYMHDGSVATLDEVLDHYAAGGRTIAEGEDAGVGFTNPYKSQFVRGFPLPDEDRRALIAFLESLTDEEFLTDPAIGDPGED